MSTETPALRKKVYCVICGPEASSKEKISERLDHGAGFSARQIPRRNHFRIMQCLGAPPEKSDSFEVESPGLKEVQNGKTTVYGRANYRLLEAV